jgi:lipopolysaccharide transport system ATP-binding protein
MSRTVISVDHLSKAYRLGQINTGTLTHDLKVWWARMRGLPNPVAKIGKELPADRIGETIWALRDINLQIAQGEILGIIGRNGAGKSTLLKILSEVTAPTSGEVRVKGRISSLLEVGTGFHPDLTGRENIYLNGAILGMNRKEINRKFDQIVDFSGVEQFIDTPVKRYSSGMYVRLAFAVAAHLEPDILLVDEVLAVGDAEFQRKCLGKMGDVAAEGRTVLFVSHNMTAISILCPKTILLKAGEIEVQGQTSHVIDEYLSIENNKSAVVSWQLDNAPGNEIAKLVSIKILNEKDNVTNQIWMDESIKIKIEFLLKKRARIEVSLHLFNQQDFMILATGNFNNAAWRDKEHEPGFYSCSCIIPKNLLNEGQYHINIYLGKDKITYAHATKVISFTLLDSGKLRDGWTGKWRGLIRPILSWTAEKIGDLH